MKQMGLLLIIFFIGPDLSKLLLFQHALNKKCINEIFYILFFFGTKSLKSCMFYKCSIPRFRLAIQMLSGHLGLVASTLDRKDLERLSHL